MLPLLELLTLVPLIALWWLACWGYGAAAWRIVRPGDEGLATGPLFTLVSQWAAGAGLVSLLTLLTGFVSTGFATALGICAVGVLLAVSQRGWSARVTRATADLPRGAWLAAAMFLLASLMLALAPPGLLWQTEPNGYDVTSYHLQIPREWYEGGRVVPLWHNVFSFFPQLVEMHSLLAFGLMRGAWNGMYVAQAMHATMTFMGVLAVVAALSGRQRPAALVLCLVLPWLWLLSPIAYVEGPMMLFVAVTFGWALSVASVRAAVWTGLLAGLTCGCKYTLVPMVLLPVVVGACVAVARPLTHRLRDAAVLLVIATVAISPWLVRNMVWTSPASISEAGFKTDARSGNPVFPLAMEALGAAHFSAGQVARFEAAHSATADQRSLSGRCTAFVTQIVLAPQYGLLGALTVGAAFLPLVLRRQSADFSSASAGWLAATLVWSAGVWLFATHLQGRFFLTAAVPAIWLIARLPWLAAGRVKTLGSLAAVGLAAGVPAAITASHRLSVLTDHPELLALADPSALLPQTRPEAAGPIRLVGDTRAFFHTGPTLYRTVFDLPDSTDVAETWSVRPGELIYLDGPEMARLSNTYHIPPPPDWAATQRGYVRWPDLTRP